MRSILGTVAGLAMLGVVGLGGQVVQAEPIPWEIRNHPNPCLEHKKSCESGKELGTWDGAICEVLEDNCRLHAEGKYKPETVKAVYKQVRLKDEPESCWKYREAECADCAADCGECYDLEPKCKDELWAQWQKVATTVGRTKVSGATPAPATGTVAPAGAGAAGAAGVDPVEACRKQLASVVTHLEAYRTQNGEYPFTLGSIKKDGRVVLGTEQLKDPWGQQLAFSGNKQGYSLCSSGADLKKGTADDLCLKSDKGAAAKTPDKTPAAKTPAAKTPAKTDKGSQLKGVHLKKK
jgi:hypothetical protein